VNSLQIPFVDGAVALAGLAERLSQKCDTALVTAEEGMSGHGNPLDQSSMLEWPWTNYSVVPARLSVLQVDLGSTKNSFVMYKKLAHQSTTKNGELL